jgi:hypothetical protein
MPRTVTTRTKIIASVAGTHSTGPNDGMIRPLLSNQLAAAPSHENLVLVAQLDYSTSVYSVTNSRFVSKIPKR